MCVGGWGGGGLHTANTSQELNTHTRAYARTYIDAQRPAGQNESLDSRYNHPYSKKPDRRQTVTSPAPLNMYILSQARACVCVRTCVCVCMCGLSTV